MAISKGRITQELHAAGCVQPCFMYRNDISGGGPSLQVLDPSPSLEFFCQTSSKAMLEEPCISMEPVLVDYTTVSNQLSLYEPTHGASSSGGGSSSSFVFGSVMSRSKEPQSVLTFKTAPDHSLSNVSMLSFELETQAAGSLKLSYGDDPVASTWDQDAIFPSHHDVLHHLNPRLISGTADHSVSQEANCFKVATTYGYGDAVDIGAQEHKRDEEFGWFYSEDKHDHMSRSPDEGAQKRPCLGNEASSPKRQCTSSNRKSKPKAVASKDTQSIAAKNRRERISERLKVLQALVPNGTKVDLVTMLEKAISYVKFLQLQVTVLSTDEFWPAQGGKAPAVAQVKEAIDAILSSSQSR